MVSQSWKQNRGWWKPIPLTHLGFTESIMKISTSSYFELPHSPDCWARNVKRTWLRSHWPVITCRMVDDGRSDGRTCWVCTAVCLGNLYEFIVSGMLRSSRCTSRTSKYYLPSRGKVWMFTRSCNGVEARHVILGDPLKPTKPEAPHMKNSWSMFDIPTKKSRHNRANFSCNQQDSKEIPCFHMFKVLVILEWSWGV